MNVYTCDDHEGHWPVGTASIVIAENEDAARRLLIKELAKQGLHDDDFTIKLVDTTQEQAIVLRNGDY